MQSIHYFKLSNGYYVYPFTRKIILKIFLGEDNLKNYNKDNNEFTFLIGKRRRECSDCGKIVRVRMGDFIENFLIKGSKIVIILLICIIIVIINSLLN